MEFTIPYESIGRTFSILTYLHAVAKHNVHKNERISQEGGTGILAFDMISRWIPELRSDRTRLGIWCWINLKVKNQQILILLCAYQQ